MSQSSGDLGANRANALRRESVDEDALGVGEIVELDCFAVRERLHSR
jgi:hypothetical protein